MRSSTEPATRRTEGSTAIPLTERENVVERWFEDLFTRGNLDAVDDLVAPEDRYILETSTLILRAEGGIVQEIWSEMSDLQVVMQLGAFPVPEGEKWAHHCHL